MLFEWRTEALFVFSYAMRYDTTVNTIKYYLFSAHEIIISTRITRGISRYVFSANSDPVLIQLSKTNDVDDDGVFLKGYAGKATRGGNATRCARWYIMMSCTSRNVM